MQNISTHIKQVLDDKHNLNVKVIISKVGEYKMYGNQELDLSGDYDIFTAEKNLNYYKITVKEEYYLNQLNTLPNDIIPTTKTPIKIVIDYSSPNVAKEMHVGHLRSTIIGDSIANFYELLGHEVVRINHIGDFGLQFGMMIEYIIDKKLTDNVQSLNLQDLYEKTHSLSKTDNEFLQASQKRTYELQNKIEPAYKIHQEICDMSRIHFNENYKILNIKNIQEMGESYYQNLIPDMIARLEEKGLIEKENECSIIKTLINKNLTALTVVKSSGGYTYDTTDLCALEYRSQVMKADKILYCIDSGQSLHMSQIFQVGEKMNWIKTNQAYHINFGLVLGEDGKRIKSRDGGTLKLMELFEETLKKTANIVKEKNASLTNEEIHNLGIASLKYAELKSNRLMDYKFSYDKMLSFTGDTMCYIMYANVRLIKIMANVEKHENENFDKIIKINELNDKDIDLLKFCFKLPEIIEQVQDTYCLHHLCKYLYDLVSLITALYKSNKVIFFENTMYQINYERLSIFKLCKKIIDFVFKVLNVEELTNM